MPQAADWEALNGRQRRGLIYALRSNGLGPTAIGDIVGLSRERARQLLRQVDQDISQRADRRFPLPRSTDVEDIWHDLSNQLRHGIVFALHVDGVTDESIARQTGCPVLTVRVMLADVYELCCTLADVRFRGPGTRELTP